MKKFLNNLNDNENNISSAFLHNAPIGNYKINLIAAIVRGKTVEESMRCLRFSSKVKGALILSKLIYSAASNARNNTKFSVDSLFVKSIEIGKGNCLRRFHARAKGRGCAIIKHRSNIRVFLAIKV
ncbi:MAG: 50S ribosomal protein L22 [Anaplasmataceae bacterium]|nr:50S ribosomal protein L22 [Candidatus Heimdallarchaeota archaeon]MDH5796147.1 50S ribosomal protein L22 [Anaplasmataceae bacterium]